MKAHTRCKGVSTLLSNWSVAGRICCAAISLRVQPVNSGFGGGFERVVATILPNHVVGDILDKAPLTYVAVGERELTLSRTSLN